jgi:trimeric autotransporter adhesin
MVLAIAAALVLGLLLAAVFGVHAVFASKGLKITSLDVFNLTAAVLYEKGGKRFSIQHVSLRLFRTGPERSAVRVDVHLKGLRVEIAQTEKHVTNSSSSSAAKPKRALKLPVIARFISLTVADATAAVTAPDGSVTQVQFCGLSCSCEHALRAAAQANCSIDKIMVQLQPAQAVAAAVTAAQLLLFNADGCKLSITAPADQLNAVQRVCVQCDLMDIGGGLRAMQQFKQQRSSSKKPTAATAAATAASAAANASGASKKAITIPASISDVVSVRVGAVRLRLEDDTSAAATVTNGSSGDTQQQQQQQLLSMLTVSCGDMTSQNAAEQCACQLQWNRYSSGGSQVQQGEVDASESPRVHISDITFRCADELMTVTALAVTPVLEQSETAAGETAAAAVTATTVTGAQVRITSVTGVIREQLAGWLQFASPEKAPVLADVNDIAILEQPVVRPNTDSSSSSSSGGSSSDNSSSGTSSGLAVSVAVQQMTVEIADMACSSAIAAATKPSFVLSAQGLHCIRRASFDAAANCHRAVTNVVATAASAALCERVRLSFGATLETHSTAQLQFSCTAFTARRSDERSIAGVLQRSLMTVTARSMSCTDSVGATYSRGVIAATGLKIEQERLSNAAALCTSSSQKVTLANVDMDWTGSTHVKLELFALRLPKAVQAVTSKKRLVAPAPGRVTRHVTFGNCCVKLALQLDNNSSSSTNSSSSSSGGGAGGGSGSSGTAVTTAVHVVMTDADVQMLKDAATVSNEFSVNNMLLSHATTTTTSSSTTAAAAAAVVDGFALTGSIADITAAAQGGGDAVAASSSSNNSNTDDNSNNVLLPLLQASNLKCARSVDTTTVGTTVTTVEPVTTVAHDSTTTATSTTVKTVHNSHKHETLVLTAAALHCTLPHSVHLGDIRQYLLRQWRAVKAEIAGSDVVSGRMDSVAVDIDLQLVTVVLKGAVEPSLSGAVLTPAYTTAATATATAGVDGSTHSSGSVSDNSAHSNPGTSSSSSSSSSSSDSAQQWGAELLTGSIPGGVGAIKFLNVRYTVKRDETAAQLQQLIRDLDSHPTRPAITTDDTDIDRLTYTQVRRCILCHHNFLLQL